MFIIIITVTCSDLYCYKSCKCVDVYFLTLFTLMYQETRRDRPRKGKRRAGRRVKEFANWVGCVSIGNASTNWDWGNMAQTEGRWRGEENENMTVDDAKMEPWMMWCKVSWRTLLMSNNDKMRIIKGLFRIFRNQNVERFPNKEKLKW